MPPFFSSPAVRAAYERAEKRDKHLGEVMGEAMNGDHDDDHETVPHDRAGRPLDPETREPLDPDDAAEAEAEDADDDDYDGGVVAQKHAVGRAVEVFGTGHGNVSRPHIGPHHHPQPADAGSLSTPRSGALASSVGSNPAEVQVQQLDYRAQSGPQVTFPHAGPLAQPALHPARPTGGSR